MERIIRKCGLFAAILLFVLPLCCPQKVSADTGKWIRSGDRWWYQYEDHTYPQAEWVTIDGKKYYFDEEGWMVTGWQKIEGKWYLFASSGEMLTDWHKVSGKWYFMDDDGVMATGWLKDGGKWYYLSGSGAMVTGWLKDAGKWYYLSGSGAMVTGWLKIGDEWYYFDSSGAMAADIWIGPYYVDENGVWIPDKVKGKMVAIDAGHQRQGNSSREPMGPGSSETKVKVSSGTSGKWSGLKEYELNLQVALQLRDELEARGYEVYMIRETHDVDISNAERAQMASQAGADILVRIHANGDDNSEVHGALTMAPSSSNSFLTQSVIKSSNVLSQKMIDCFCEATGARNRGVMTTDTMSGINWSTIPVTIIEMGFMTNKEEDLKMASSSYQGKMVQGIANGIDQYYESGM